MYVVLPDAVGRCICAANELAKPISMHISMLFDVSMTEYVAKYISGKY